MVGNTQDSQIRNAFINLGFSDVEINEFLKAKSVHEMYNKKPTRATLTNNLGYNYQQADRLMYMFNIYMGKVNINDSEVAQKKHLKKLNGGVQKITIEHLEVSRITSVPRKAIILNINEKTFDIWNYTNYRSPKAIYDVIDATNGTITIKTKIKPTLMYKQSKEIPGKIKIEDGLTANGECIVKVSKKYASLCNTYVITASTRLPERHLGMVKVLCFEGTTIYVYVKDIGIRCNISAKQNERIYDYGIFPKDINNKLKTVAEQVYNRIGGVKVEYINPNSKFIPFNRPDSLKPIDNDNDVEV